MSKPRQNSKPRPKRDSHQVKKKQLNRGAGVSELVSESNEKINTGKQPASIIRKVARIGYYLFLVISGIITLSAAAPLFAFNPTVTMKTQPDGKLAPFEIVNPSKVFTFSNFTPDCVVVYALWKTHGNIISFGNEHPKPETSNTSLMPGSQINFECEINRVMAPPQNYFENDLSSQPRLLETIVKVDIDYSLRVWFFEFRRSFESPEYCGVGKSSGIFWTRGVHTAPNSAVSEELDKSSFYSGDLSRCFTEEEIKRALGVIGETSISSKNDGFIVIRMPKNGEFGE